MNKRRGEILFIFLVFGFGVVVGFDIASKAMIEDEIKKGKYLAFQEAEKLGYAERIITSAGDGYRWVIPASTTAEIECKHGK